jgi:hypothetical protein
VGCAMRVAGGHAREKRNDQWGVGELNERKAPRPSEANLIFPHPCEFINSNLPHCAVVRPTLDRNGGAQAAITSFTDDNLFQGQSSRFFKTVRELAEQADAAQRRVG